MKVEMNLPMKADSDVLRIGGLRDGRSHCANQSLRCHLQDSSSRVSYGLAHAAGRTVGRSLWEVEAGGRVGIPPESGGEGS